MVAGGLALTRQHSVAPWDSQSTTPGGDAQGPAPRRVSRSVAHVVAPLRDRAGRRGAQAPIVAAGGTARRNAILRTCLLFSNVFAA